MIQYFEEELAHLRYWIGKEKVPFDTIGVFTIQHIAHSRYIEGVCEIKLELCLEE